MKRLNVIREKDKIYYKIEERFLWFWWEPYIIKSLSDSSVQCDIKFDNREKAEIFINWKDIKYLGKTIKLDWNNIWNRIQYRVFGENAYMYNCQCNTVEDAKTYIESLPRTINYKYYK